jgi:sodium/hydrogen antiporter
VAGPWIAFAACVVAYALVARKFEALSITGPIVFVAIGLAFGLAGRLTLNVGSQSETVRVVTGLALALLLFSDAATIDLRALRAAASVPIRLLLIGLPLTVALGALVAKGLLPGLGIGVAALIAAILAPTDLSLGLAMFNDPRVPGRTSRAINVESGLNDGIATPFVALFIGVAISEFDHTGGPLKEAVLELLLGIGVGVLAGCAGAWLMSLSRKAGWSSGPSRQFAAFALALVTYFGALAIHGNGFIAAFVGGLAFGAIGHVDAAHSAGYAEETGTLLTLAVWFMFGAGVGPVLLGVGLAWQPIVYALLSLTVLRMLPVAISLLGARQRPETVWFVGWFGPRGLASVVFLLQASLALDQAGLATSTLVATVGWTILLSVILHGVSAGPVAAWYGKRAASFPAGSAELEPGSVPVNVRIGVTTPSSAVGGSPAD